MKYRLLKKYLIFDCLFLLKNTRLKWFYQKKRMVRYYSAWTKGFLEKIYKYSPFFYSLKFRWRKKYAWRQKEALFDRKKIQFLFFPGWRYKRFKSFINCRLHKKDISFLNSLLLRIELRFSNFLSRLFKNLSIENIQKLIQRGDFWVFGRKVFNHNYLLDAYECWGVKPKYFGYYYNVLGSVSSWKIIRAAWPPRKKFR